MSQFTCWRSRGYRTLYEQEKKRHREFVEGLRGWLEKDKKRLKELSKQPDAQDGYEKGCFVGAIEHCHQTINKINELDKGE